MHNPSCILGRGHHCGACHLSFGSLELFDAHRYGHGDNRRCATVDAEGRMNGYFAVVREMVRVNLVQDNQGVWQTLAAQERNNRANRNLAKARSTRSTLEQSP